MFVSHYRDARPLADQLGDDLRRLVSTGAWAEGETLPSVAALASSLSLNPKAIRQAYDTLVREGYVQPGEQGLVVLPQGERNDQRRRALLGQFDKTAGELLLLGYTREQLSLRLKEVHA